MGTKPESDTRDLVSRVRNGQLRHSVEEIVPRLLYPGESLYGVVEGVEAPGLDGRATFGSSWPWLHRVVLLVTDRRLLELAVRPMARDLEGRIRTFPWSKVVEIACNPQRVRLSSRDGLSTEWILRSPLRSEALAQLKRSAPPLGELFGGRVCDRCGSAAFNRQRTCSGCTAKVVDSREVAGRGWTIPGAGLMMTRHPVLGAGRFLLELAAVLVAGLAVLWADSALALAAVGVGAAIVLVLVKIESVRIARREVDRTGVGMRWNGPLWRRMRTPMIVLFAVLLVTPLFFAGSIDSQITADLDFIVPEQNWKRAQGNPETDETHLRSVWVHRDGWTVTVTAEAFERFAGFKETRRGLEAASDADVQPVADAQFEAFLVIDPAPSPDLPQRETRVALHVFDRSGRDIHTITTLAPASVAPDRAIEIQDLLRHAVWVDRREDSDRSL